MADKIETDENRSPTMANVVRRYVEQALRSTYTMMPGRVESFDPDTQTASVQPLFRLPVAGAVVGEGITEADLLENLPVLPDVPVQFMRTKHATIYMDVAKGSHVMLLFSMFSMEKFLQGAGDEGTIDPQDTRHHSLSDAVAVPGLYPGTLPIEGFVEGNIQIKNHPENGKESTVYLDGTSGDIVLIPADGSFVQLGEAVGKELALLGETAIADLETVMQSFADNAPTIVQTALGPGVLAPPVVAAIGSFISGLSAWLTSKTKVS